MKPKDESALLIPVPESEPLVSDWRSLYDGSAARGMPAHITLLYPFVAPGEIDDELIEELGSHFARKRAFTYSYPTTARFPGVLYLAPDADAPFSKMISALEKRFPDCPPYGGLFEDVIPHLTVGDCRNRLDLALMNRMDAELMPQLPLEARASEVWLMTSRRGRWRKRHVFPLRA